ncbi:hypothetical protein AVL61_16015 [Kocuria rosea subsp. polaris]|uniref:Uncharacterized protein n=1 Tax=Kocuria rosea subsp. polaris TaxID=136273 RepID=A0A0W8IB72_KOCRO|nr:hypothetical protein AVL61_16015 [Kocuria polaris]
MAGAALWSGAALAPAAAAGGVDLVLGTRVVLDEATVGQATEGAARLCGGPPSGYVKRARKAARTGSIVVLCTRPGNKQVYFR